MLNRVIWVVLLVFSPLVLAEKVTITKSDLQAIVASSMPIEHTTFYTKVTVRTPVVVLDPKRKRMFVGFHVDAHQPSMIKDAATGDIEAMLLYDPAKGTIYLHGPTVYNLQYDGVDGEAAISVGDAAKEAITKKMSGLVIHTIADKAVRQQLVKAAVVAVAVESDQVVVTLGKRK